MSSKWNEFRKAFNRLDEKGLKDLDKKSEKKKSFLEDLFTREVPEEKPEKKSRLKKSRKYLGR